MDQFGFSAPSLPADGRPPEDGLLAGYHDIGFPLKHNYQGVECLQFYISKKNCKGAVVKYGQQMEALLLLLNDLLQYPGMVEAPPHKTWVTSLHILKIWMSICCFLGAKLCCDGWVKLGFRIHDVFCASPDLEQVFSGLVDIPEHQVNPWYVGASWFKTKFCQNAS